MAERHAPPARRLTVRTELNGQGVVIHVDDRGHGIQQDRLEQVFAPFFTTKPHGLGLGLTVCRTIIAAHGGKLWASDNPDGGASFHINLLPVTAGKADGET